MRFEDALADFTTQLRADGRSEHTVAQYNLHTRLIARWWATLGRADDVTALDHRDVAAFMVSNSARLRPDGAAKKATAVNALRSSLKCFFGYLHAIGMSPRNPTVLLRRARCATPPPRAIEDEDLARMLAAMDADGGWAARRDRVLFGLIAETGVRLGSAVAIKVADFDLDRGFIEVRRTKGDAPYRVRIGEELVGLLRAHLASTAHGWTFVGAGGRNLSTRQVQRRFEIWAERAGIERRVTVHGLRHRVGRRVYAATGDVLAVQRQLGHRSLAATQLYLESLACA